MENSKSEDKILGKRKKSLDSEKEELEMINPKDDIGNSVKEKASSKTEVKDEENSEPGKEDSSKLVQEKKESSEAARENSKEQNKEEEIIEKMLCDALDIAKEKMDVENAAVEKAYIEIKEAFKTIEFTKLNFNNSDYALAYYYSYAAFNIKLAYNRFLDAFKNCNQLQETVKKQSLNIISLGGGPGTDIIGFCSALQEFLLTQEVKNYCSAINISVTDKFEGWASFYNVIESLIREGNYGNVSTLFKSKDVCSSFMIVDLVSEEQPCKYISELETADIVLLVRVLDVLNFRETKPENLIKKIISGMRSGALMIVIDSAIKKYNDSDKVIQVYSSNLETFTKKITMEIPFRLYPWKSSCAQSFILQKK